MLATSWRLRESHISMYNCKWVSLPMNWCRISAVNSRIQRSDFEKIVHVAFKNITSLKDAIKKCEFFTSRIL